MRISIGSWVASLDWKGGTNVKLRIKANQTFLAKDNDGTGVLVEASPNVAREVTCTVDDVTIDGLTTKRLTVPALWLFSTDDAITNKAARYSAQFVTSSGKIIENIDLLSNFNLPKDIVALSSPTTWYEIIRYNFPSAPIPVDRETYSKTEILTLINNITGSIAITKGLNPANQRLTFWTSASQIDADAELTWNSSANRLGLTGQLGFTGIADPGAPVDGEMWFSGGVHKVRQSGATRTLASLNANVGTLQWNNAGSLTDVNGSAVQTDGRIALQPPTTSGLSAGFTDFDFGFDRDLTFTAGAPIAANDSLTMYGPTLVASAPSRTFTRASTLYIGNQPIPGANVTITNAYGLFIDGSARAQFTGHVRLGTVAADVRLRGGNIKNELEVNGTLSLPPINAPSISSQQDNWSVGGTDLTGIIHINAGANCDITGFAPAAGKSSGSMYFLHNKSSFTVTLKHQHTGSLIANRFFCIGAADIALAANEIAFLTYDGTRWTVSRFNAAVASLNGTFSQVKNVKLDYAAVGNGVADDTAALQAAINAGGYVYIPPGVYLISSPLTIPTQDENGSLVLVGAGNTRSIIRQTGTGNGFTGNDVRIDQFVFADFRIETSNASSVGDGFNFTGLASVQTNGRFERVAVFNFGGWGLQTYNMQSSQIVFCHFRNNKFGHIALADDNIGEFTREPNGNTIAFNLLDNCPSHANNVAVVKLLNSNGSSICFNTLQGHWVGGGGNDPCIWVDQSRGVSIKNNHIEAGSSVSAAGILITNSFGTTIENGTGSGLHTKDIEGQNSKGVRIIGGCFINDVPHFTLDAACREWAVIGGRYLTPTNMTKSDSSPDGLSIEGVTYHAQTSSFIMSIDKWNGAREQSMIDLWLNGNFTIDTSLWTGAATGITRVSTGAPPNDGPYILCNTQGLGDGGQVGGTNFTQTYNVPNSVPTGVYTLVFNFYVEDLGSPFNAVRFLDLEFSGTGFSGSTAFRITSQDARFTTGIWYQCKIQDTLGAGTGRTIKVNINPTQGPSTPRVRFANFHLYRGKSVMRDSAPALLHHNNAFYGTQQFLQNSVVEVTGGTTGSPRKFGLGHLSGSGFAAGEAGRFLLGDDFNSIQSHNSGVMVVQSFHGLRFYGHTFGGTTGAEAPIGFFSNNTADPHHWFISSNGGFSVNVSDNPNLRIQSASNSTSAYKAIQCTNSAGTERWAVMEDGSIRVQGTKVIGTQGAAVADAAGGATVDAEARAAINALLARARTHGLIAT